MRGAMSYVSEQPSEKFFFQAEDGIRDDKVTGVQTCALPILSSHRSASATALARATAAAGRRSDSFTIRIPAGGSAARDEARCRARGSSSASGASSGSGEGRVGEEGRSRWLPFDLKKKTEGVD